MSALIVAGAAAAFVVLAIGLVVLAFWAGWRLHQLLKPSTAAAVGDLFNAGPGISSPEAKAKGLRVVGEDG